MKIVFLHTDFRVYWLPRLRALDAFLKSNKHQLHVIEISGQGSPYAFSQKRGNSFDISWECLFPNASMTEIPPVMAKKSIFRTLDRLSPDIVFSGAIAYPSGAAAVHYCRLHKLPVVIFDNARLADVPRNGVTNFIKRNIYHNVDAVLIPAPSHIPDFIFWDFTPEQIYMGLNVVDNNYWKNFARNAEKEESTLTTFGLRKPFILGVGRQVPKKNWKNLLEAYSKHSYSFSLLLVGNGDDRPDIERYIAHKALKNKVILLDFQSPETLAILYKNALATILPSFAGETWGLTINEAMACGSPVLVSTQCGCCNTLCLDGETGFRFSPNAEGIASALRRLDALSQEEITKLRENAEKKISDWGVERFSESVLQAAEDLCSHPALGFRSLVSRVIIEFWKGRYRPV